MSRPNLFHFATSELSQDAFICWLLSWAAPEYKSINEALHDLALKLMSAFFKKRNMVLPSNIKKVKIERQHKNIDVLAIINDSIALVIENKIYTREHSDQLKRYLSILKEKGFSEEKIIPIYIQIGEQGDYSKIKEAGFW